MSIRFLSVRTCIQTAVFLSAVTLAVQASFSQQTPTPAPAQTPAQQTPAPAQQAQAPATPAQSAPAAASKVPDYPDPRTPTVGFFGLYSLSSPGPDIRGGVIASYSNIYESLYGLGQPYKYVPQIELSVPVTRTGTLYLDLERYHGSGYQTLTRASQIDTYSFNPGDFMNTAYHINTGRLYLDDLLYPEKFPVSRLRFRSIWGVRYVGMTHSLISPTEDANAGTPGASFQINTNYVMLPEFGLAMEYALAPHVLFRVDGAGFGLPHRSDVGETSASLSVRRHSLELMMGVKTLHFKTTPKKEEYEVGTFITPFVGFRWHF